MNAEEVIFSDTTGEQLTLGAWEYKVPAAHDVPLEFNVRFEANVPNPSPVSVLGSKASGEPPMALGAAVALAVRDAIRAARRDTRRGAHSAGAPHLELPLTVERIATLCNVDPSAFVLR